MANGDTIRYSGYTREDARRWLEQRKRIRMPWHTETSPEDPINAMLDIEADRMAVDSVRWDMAASEQFWSSLQRRASAVALGRIIDYRLSAATPATVRMIARLSAVPPSFPATVIPEQSAYATEGDDTSPTVPFEADADLVMAAATIEVYLDSSTKDVYFGHRTMMFDAVAFTAAVYAIGYTYTLEAWDGVTEAWVAVAGETDGTASLSQAGTISWDVPTLHPDDGSAAWLKTTVNAIEGYWVRMRKTVAGATPPGTPAATAGAAVHWHALWDATQGESVVDALGTTTGAAFEAFALTRTPYVEGSLDQVAFGTDTTWTLADSLYLAGPTDKVYVLQERSDGLYIMVGDGITGAIPPLGVAVEAGYRINADTDGNVGPSTVTINRTGTPRLEVIWNPIAASGWLAPEGAISDAYTTEAAALARTREIAPATQRALGRAVSLEDHETLAVRWAASDGRKPVARAYAITTGAGPRGVSLLACGAAGAALSAADIAELQEYFTGVRRGTQRVGGVAMDGAEVTVAGFGTESVTGTATIRVLARYAATAKALAEAAVAAIVTPLALSADGVDWRWWPGQTYDPDLLKAAIVAAVPGFVSFDSWTPASIALGATELPTLVSFTVTVVEV